MNKEEFDAKLGGFYDAVKNNRDNDDYVVNHAQMDKLIKIANFFTRSACEMEGGLRIDDLEPKLTSGRLSATFVVFSICGDCIKEFSEIMSLCDAIEITPMVGRKICISCIVSNVYVVDEA